MSSHHIYFANQKYAVIIIKDFQYTYETLRFKITSFLKLLYMGGCHINKEFVVGISFL